jgi:hypothetical protein
MPSALPAAVQATACRVCKFPIWTVPASDQAAKALRRDRPVHLLYLEPNHRPEGGVKVLSGLGVFDPDGDFAMHACPARVIQCKYCGERVRKVNQAPGSPETLAVLDPDPDPAGTVVITERGFALHDPNFEQEGTRYRWHLLHGRAAANPRPRDDRLFGRENTTARP